MLAVTAVTSDTAPDTGDVNEEYARSGMPVRSSTRAEVEPLFAGTELAEPGIVLVHRWHPEPGTAARIADSEIGRYAAVGIKP